MTTTAFVGLGSNVGDRLAHLRAALRALRTAPGIVVVRTSSVYDTDPVGPMQRNFLNGVVAIETTLGPHELLAALKRIERIVGRRARSRHGPREIDLDLLSYGVESVGSPDLVIPHPSMSERAFVLVPLAEIERSAADAGPSEAVRFHQTL